LTDHEIARLQHVFKWSGGVADPRWYDPQGPMGTVLARRNLDAIAAFEDVPRALAHFRRAYSVNDVQLYLPERN
ncbi:MAG TPA: hypothetical protein VKU41_07590, partial [Polyangiaceae bacterium]|nr:hypothetical protein [Polyangiaceae bacterium]